MWKDYSQSYLRNNRSSSLSVMIAASISALLLSLLCGLFYNLWKYEIERIQLTTGGWQSRITWELDQEDIASIKNYATVKEAVVNDRESHGGKTTVDLCFYHMGDVLEGTSRAAGLAGIPQEAITYNYELLAMYLIRDSGDKAPRLVFPLFLLITAIAAISLSIVIHNAFAMSMNARIHQFGILSSVGATPGQIRTCLLEEAAALCAIPVIAGSLLGIVVNMGLLHMVNRLLGSDIPGRHPSVFGYHPLVLGIVLLLAAATVGIAAWIPARRLSRMTPLEAIKNTGELTLRRRNHSFILAGLFGMEGELAGNALKAQKKALRTSSLSLILSFLAFTLMQCFFTLSEISTRETYFERYQDAWDIMVTVKAGGEDSFGMAEAIQGLSRVESAIVYEKAAAKRLLTEEEISDGLRALGGFSHGSGQLVTPYQDGWLVNAPIIIMDDNSFLAYCEQLDIEPKLDGAVICNRIQDMTNPDFRHRRYLPYMKEENSSTVLRQPGHEEITCEIPVLAYTDKVPVLREEYGTLDYYELVHFIPVSLWRTMGDRLGGTGEDTCIRVLAAEHESLEELNSLQAEIDGILAGDYEAESENRIEEYELNKKQIQGMKLIFGGFCVLLAIIGIGNIFSNTLGFVRQRRREFARYLSVGLTPKAMGRMFFLEGLTVAGRPMIITLPLAATAVGYMLNISYLEPGEFLAEAPFLPVFVFMAFVWGAVALAYYLGWRGVGKISLAEVLKDDTMM